ncbi:hypothetical protein [Robiginitalea sp. IMCC43444]|uniref:hypothetical protein n=1 Tax=Robiginitalea sp. IMCC43444 TaxID=3459121 RepID=UPI004041E154
MKNAGVLLLMLASFLGYGQTNLSEYQNVKSVFVVSQWGELSVTATKKGDNRPFQLSAAYTDTSHNKQRLSRDLAPFISITEEAEVLYIKAREPKGFESVDMELRLPEELFVNLQLIRGGNIYVHGLKGGLEVNILNGSVRLEALGNYALVNAANGSIDASFASLDPRKPVSLVTMNGEVSVSLPEDASREVRLISRKNGFIRSDFQLQGAADIKELNISEYANYPISYRTSINGGGSLLFLSTENGPLRIRKN